MRKLTKEELTALTDTCAVQLTTAHYSHCVSILRREQQELIVSIYNSIFTDDKARVGDSCMQCWARWCERIAALYFEGLKEQENAVKVHQEKRNHRKNSRG